MTLKIESKEQFEAWMMEHAKPFNWDIRPEGPVFMPEDVRALYEALRPRWVSVSERLPDKGIRVLVLDPTIWEFPRNDTHTVIGHYRGANHFAGSDWYVPDGMGEVTHWMPLPPLPEES